MQIRNKDLLIQAIEKETIKSILFFGQDRGLMSVIISLIEQNFDFDVMNIDFASITPESYTVLVNDLNLFGKKRLIRISNTPNKISKKLEQVILGAHTHLSIFYGEAINSKSTITKFFDISDSLASYPCYQIQENNIKKATENILREKQYTSEVLLYLTSSYNNNYQLYLNDLKKLLLYVSDKKNITLQDITKIMSKPKIDFNSKNICYSLLLEYSDRFYQALREIHETPLIQVIRGIMFFLMQIYVGSLYIAQNSSATVEEAIKIQKIPIFFKDVQEYKLILQRVSLIKIQKLFSMLQSLEKQAKISSHITLLEKIYLDLHLDSLSYQ